MLVLMDKIGEAGERGKEKSCASRNFPGLLGFRIMDKGDVWKGPMAMADSS